MKIILWSVFGILGFIALVYLFTYIFVLIKENMVIKCFTKIDALLKKRYHLISDVLSVVQKYMVNEKSLIVDILSLKTKLSTLPSDKKYIDRKIALNSVIENEMEQIISAVENYSELKSEETMMNIIQIYNEHEKNIKSQKLIYNKAARKLRNASDVFPSSFVARMSEVKFTNYYN